MYAQLQGLNLGDTHSVFFAVTLSQCPRPEHSYHSEQQTQKNASARTVPDPPVTLLPALDHRHDHQDGSLLVVLAVLTIEGHIS